MQSYEEVTDYEGSSSSAYEAMDLSTGLESSWSSLAPHSVSSASPTAEELEEHAAAMSYYEYQEGVGGSSIVNETPLGAVSCVPVPGSPLPADRLARKQRNFPRRGGFAHSSLLRSAVYAHMSEVPSNPLNSATPAGDSFDLMNAPPRSNGNAPRKRVRRTDHATRMPLGGPSSSPGKIGTKGAAPSSITTENAYIDRATDLLQKLSVDSLDGSQGRGSRHLATATARMAKLAGLSNHSSSRRTIRIVDHDFDRSEPIRRVSRRTSYQSQISTGTADYEDDLDEFH